jgi:hypothetical protein
MRESCTSGSVRGASSDRRLYSTLSRSRGEDQFSIACFRDRHFGMLGPSRCAGIVQVSRSRSGEDRATHGTANYGGDAILIVAEAWWGRRR